MKRRWLIALALPALAATCGGSDDTSALRAQVAALQTQVAPDRVVGIEIRCDFWPTEGSHRDYWGAICSEYYGTDAAGLVADSSIGVREGSSGGGAFFWHLCQTF